MIYVYLKDTVSILLPFLFIHLLLQYFYQTSLFSVATWWFKYFFKVEYKEVLLIGLFFTFFAFFTSIASIIQNISLAFYGEKHEMVYVGNISENESLLYHAKDLTLEPIKEYNFTHPTTSFINIYHKTVFLRDKGTNRLGAPKSQFSLGSFLQVIWVMLILAPIFLAVLHALAYPVSVKSETMDFSPNIPLGDSFTALLQSYGITPLKFVAFPILVIFLPLILPNFSSNKTSEFRTNRAISLPIEIRSNHLVNVLPVNSFREIIDNISNGPDTDTGMRSIIFKFEEGFKIPVYVTYKYDSKQHPNLEELANNNILHGTKMQVKILEDLSIELIKQPLE